MWIVKIALERPYTFIVLALLILILSPVVILNTPTDIFPNIDIPVVAVSWTYTGMNPEELEGRLTTVYEKVLTTLVDNIEHIESTTVNGTVVVKIFLQPTASVDRANAQVTAASQTILRQLPPGTLPPLIVNYTASSVPILQLALSGQGLSEADLNDLAMNFLRPQLVTVPGAAVPYPYGGKQREVMVNLDSGLLQSKGLSPQDVVNAVDAQNVIAPTGTAKIDQFEYDIGTNSAPRTVEEMNNLPVKVVGNSTIYVRDVSHVSDGFIPQTNIVRQDGHRGVLATVIKDGNASTLSVVQGIRNLLPRVQQTLPPQLKIQQLADQSVFVRAAVSGVVREAGIAAVLTALMILIFLGSWRSTVIIAVSIPLAILSSVIILSLLHQTINLMTLGGLALAVGILVDDATVTIENISRHLEEGQPLHQGILDGAAQIAVPALVSTLCICIVFLPMFSLGGVAHYLFQPLAEAVIFAMIASYIQSRTLVPTLAMYLLKPREENAAPSRNPFTRAQKAFDREFEAFRRAYQRLLTRLVAKRVFFVPAFLLVCLAAGLLVPWLGQDFFPNTDSGQFILHVRAKTGTRIEDTARLCDLIERSIRREIPSKEVATITDNIGLPYSQLNYIYSTSGAIGASDADILVALNEKHHPTPADSYAANVRRLEDMVSFEKVYAPFDGVITVRNTDTGWLINAGAGSPSAELFQLAQTSTLRIFVAVPEVYSRAAQMGSMATLTLDEFPSQTFHGRIARTSESIDMASRTLNTEIDVDNPTGQLLPGAYVHVHLKLPAQTRSVTIPANTLLFRSEGLRVGVVRDGRAQLIPITIGVDYGDAVQVTSGLKLTDQLIVNPSDSLISGALVRIAASAAGPPQ